jgi:hypothetical protein
MLIWIQLFTLRIQIQILIKVRGICDHWSIL